MKLKKIISVLLSVLMTVSCFGAVASAAGTVEFQLVSGEASDGYYTLVIAAKNAAGLTSADLKIGYDSSEVVFENTDYGEAMPDMQKYIKKGLFMQSVNPKDADGYLRAGIFFVDYLEENDVQFISVRFSPVKEGLESVQMSIGGKYYMINGSEYTASQKSFTLSLDGSAQVGGSGGNGSGGSTGDSDEPTGDISFELVSGEASDGYYSVIIAAKNAKGFAAADFDIAYDSSVVEFENVEYGEIMPDLQKYVSKGQLIQAVNPNYKAGVLRAGITFVDCLEENNAQLIRIRFKTKTAGLKSVQMSIGGYYLMEDETKSPVSVKSFALTLDSAGSNKPSGEASIELVKGACDGSNYRLVIAVKNCKGLESANLAIGYNASEAVFPAGMQGEAMPDALAFSAVKNYFSFGVNAVPSENTIQVGFYFLDCLDAEKWNVKVDDNDCELIFIEFKAADEKLTHTVFTLSGLFIIDGKEYSFSDKQLAFSFADDEAGAPPSVDEVCKHSWGSWKVTKEATVTETGVKERTCGICKEVEKQTIAKLEKVEIAESNEVCFNEKGDILAVSGNTVEEIVSDNLDEYTVLDCNGKAVSKKAEIASGMQIIIKDEKGKVLDSKTIVVPCDVNGDAKITAADSRSTLRASVNLDKLNSWQSEAADISNDTALKADDARTILRVSVNLEDVLVLFSVFLK